jgi:hypothetical protein
VISAIHKHRMARQKKRPMTTRCHNSRVCDMVSSFFDDMYATYSLIQNNSTGVKIQ